MKRTMCIFCALLLAISIITPSVKANNLESGTQTSQYMVFSKEFPDAFFAVNQLEDEDGEYVQVTVFVEEGYSAERGYYSRLLTLDELLSAPTSGTRSGSYMPNNKYSLSISLRNSYTIEGNGIDSQLTAVASWSGLTDNTCYSPHTGVDYAAIYWAGGFLGTNLWHTGTYSNGSAVSVTNTLSYPNVGKIFSFHSATTAPAYMTNLTSHLSLSKTTLTGNGNLAEIDYTYVHSYTNTSSITVNISSDPSISVTGTTAYWTVSALSRMPY